MTRKYPHYETLVDASAAARTMRMLKLAEPFLHTEKFDRRVPEQLEFEFMKTMPLQRAPQR